MNVWLQKFTRRAFVILPDCIYNYLYNYLYK